MTEPLQALESDQPLSNLPELPELYRWKLYMTKRAHSEQLALVLQEGVMGASYSRVNWVDRVFRGKVAEKKSHITWSTIDHRYISISPSDTITMEAKVEAKARKMYARFTLAREIEGFVNKVNGTD